MPKVTLKSAAGADQGSVDLDEQYFGIEPNLPVLHQVVTAQLAARRAGTQSTKTRAEVRGGGAKPWKQKGTGRARQGSIRAPQWKGGGVALGPKPRSYAQKTPKKMIKLALRSALSDRAADGKVVVIDEWGFDTPSTKSAVAALGALEVTGRVVVVVGAEDAVAAKSFRNLPEVHLLEVGELNAYDVLCSDYIVFTRDNLPAVPADAPANKTKTKTKAEAKVKVGAKATKAGAPATEAPAAASGSTEPGGDDDMASDLPNRPKSSGEAAKPVDPSERVKPAADKTDPRFEAARIKSEKEAEVRAAKEAATDAPDEPVADEDQAAEAKPAGGFSFNQTTEGEASGQ
jgi:large subunit ribosomal protein L4